jgi:hypothetical protein
MKTTGLWQRENSFLGLETSLAIFTRALGWSKEEVDVFLIGVRDNIKDTKIHAYWPL